MKISGKKTRIVLFDGVCDLCNGFVQFLIARDPDGKFNFGALQSCKAQELLKGSQIDPNDLRTVIYLRDKKIFTRSGAALRILADLGGVWSLVSIMLLVPPFLRDLLYRYVAKHRYHWFGKRETCMVPTPELRQRFIHGRVVERSSADR